MSKRRPKPLNDIKPGLRSTAILLAIIPAAGLLIMREITAENAAFARQMPLNGAVGGVILAAGSHEGGADGKAARMAGIVQDITKRKLAEDALKESRE